MQTEYTILIAPDPSSLSGQVNNLLRRGWVVQGGVVVALVYDSANDEHIESWTQAMVKDLDEEAPALEEEPLATEQLA